MWQKGLVGQCWAVLTLNFNFHCLIQWNSRGSLNKNDRGWPEVVLVSISEGVLMRKAFSKFRSTKSHGQRNLSNSFCAKEKQSEWDNCSKWTDSKCPLAMNDWVSSFQSNCIKSHLKFVKWIIESNNYSTKDASFGGRPMAQRLSFPSKLIHCRCC